MVHKKTKNKFMYHIYFNKILFVGAQFVTTPR